MGNKKKDLESLRRLRELERQLKEYTEEDYLREAEKMEREMAKQQVNFEPPEGFFEQVLAKGKLLEAEMRKQERIESGQKTQEKNVPRSAESGSAKADAILKMSVEQGQEQGGLQEEKEIGFQKKEKSGLHEKKESSLQEKAVSGEGLAGLSAAAAGESHVGESCVGKPYVEEQPANGQMSGNMEGNEQMGEIMEGKAEDVRQKLKPLTFQTEEYGERVEIGGADQVSLRNVKLRESASEQRIGAETGNVESREKAAGEEMAKSRPGVLRSAGQASGRKPGRRKLRWRVLLVLGVLVVFMVFGVSSGGKKHFSFEQRQREGVDGQHIALNNGEFKDSLEDELEAYNNIEQYIGITSIKIGDRPYDMEFEEYQIEGRCANMIFSYGESNGLIILEYISSTETNSDYFVDGNVIDSVFNEVLDMELQITEEILEMSRKKYCTLFTIDNAYYILTSDIKLEEFKEILKDLYL